MELNMNDLGLYVIDDKKNKIIYEFHSLFRLVRIPTLWILEFILNNKEM